MVTEWNTICNSWRTAMFINRLIIRTVITVTEVNLGCLKWSHEKAIYTQTATSTVSVFDFEHCSC